MTNNLCLLWLADKSCEQNANIKLKFITDTFPLCYFHLPFLLPLSSCYITEHRYLYIYFTAYLQFLKRLNNLYLYLCASPVYILSSSYTACIRFIITEHLSTTSCTLHIIFNSYSSTSGLFDDLTSIFISLLLV